MFKDTVIVSAVRTAIGSFGGSLKNSSTIELGTVVAREAIQRTGIDSSEIEEVVMGCVGQYGLNPFLARLVGIHSGCAVKSSGQTVNRLCASGLQAIITAATTVDHGDAEVCLAGGAENMSNFPFSSDGARWGIRMGDSQLKDDLTTALCEPFTGTSTHIAVTAENIAKRYGITRTEADAYALEGQRKALKALEAGTFKNEIVPVEITVKKEKRCFDTDEYPRDTSIEQLARLQSIIKDGIVTAGNASGVNDAAAAVIVMSSQKAKQLACKPLVKIVDYAVAGVDPAFMGMGPVESTRKLLMKTGIKLEQIGLVELNEAFAPQAIACIKELGLDPKKVNVNGSGIALGHPIGATGAVITVKLIHEMMRRKVQYGLATLCIGGGQGMSVLYELN